MDTNPICPYCFADIEYDDMIDNSYDGSHHDSKWAGHCPICGKNFVWHEVYLFDRIEEFEEILIMAKFNEKALCLFHKTYDQLKKKAERRGMCHDGREKTIAKIIWKDTYDAGYNDGKDAVITIARHCPANCCGNAKPEVKECCLYDIDNAMKYRLELTEEQVSAIEWMIDHNFMTDVELSEWCDSFEDVGRI